jgi:UDP-GlcNAc:undecaprenyl-phosphate/decaprenyl-phosphate GlcNAc-1-phosphate transferase
VITSIAAILIGTLVATWLTPAVRRWASMTRLVDDPRRGRSIHKDPIPRVGGVALAVATLCPIIGLAIWENTISELMYQDGRMIVTLLVSALAVLALGLVDDLVSPPAQTRLIILIGIALFSWLGGHRIEALDLPILGLLELGAWSAPTTVLWIVGVIVAFNFIDGLDGLATGTALIVTSTLFFVALLEGNQLWMTWTGAMAGALLGFLAFNFNPASVFLGNSGSNFVGYMLAVVALETNRAESTAVAILVPMLALGLPILDAALTMVRRAMLREGMFLGELGHLHHRLLDMGLSQKRVTFALWGVTMLLCLGALTLVAPVAPLQMVLGSAISVVVFCLLLVTGYLRPADLQFMWKRGLDNLRRDKALAALAQRIATQIALERDGGSVAAVLKKLAQEGAISGAAYSRHGQDSLRVGSYDEQAKGVRSSIRLSGLQPETVTLLWAKRSSGPSPRELSALTTLLSKANATEN